ncbi:MAG: tetratricopeptide repeat protein, partial [Pirellulaceae bacterium]
MSWNLIRPRTLATLALLASLAGPTPLHCWASPPQDEKTKISNGEALLESAAVAAQNGNKFREAADTWNKLLQDFPQTTLRNKALHQIGICEIQLGDYLAAEGHLKEAIKSTNPAEVQTLARAQLFLGFSRLKLGEIALADNKANDANQWLTSSAEALGVVLEKYPEFEGTHEAAYFQGSAYEQLENHDKAIASYVRVLKFDKSKFKFDALWALGDLNARRKNFAAAREYLMEYLTNGGDLPPVNEVRFRAAMVNWQLAREAKEKGEAAREKTLLAEAQKQFEQLVAGSSPQRDDAVFNLALLQFQNNDAANSLRNFEIAAKSTNPRLAGLAAINLGRQYLDQKNFDLATQWLQKALDQKDANSVDAAHWMAQTLIAKGDFPGAFAFAKDWAAKAEPPANYELLLDQADAGFQIEAQRSAAFDLYRQLSEKDWPKNAIALYNAAYAALALKSIDEAIKLSQDFQSRHAAHDFLADAIEIESEALIAKKDYTNAVQRFRKLVTDFPNNPKNSLWQVRQGLASFLADNLDGAIATLRKTADTVKDGKLQSESLHWLGLAHAKKKELAPAIEALQKSLAAGTWNRTAETLLALAEAQGATNDWPNAEQVTERLATEFPKSEQAPRGLYLLAEHFKAAKDTTKANALYERLSKMDSAGEFGSYAAMKRGWLKIEAQDWKGAKTEFEQAIAASGDDKDLRHKSQIGLATAARNLNEIPQAVADLTKVLSDSPTPAIAVDATYELGLAHVAAKNWTEAIKQFESLLNNAAAKEIESNVRYEYAWALQSNNQAEPALAEFKKIAASNPNSVIGADAQFQVAESVYAQKDFENAIKAYNECLAAAPVDLKERILYRLGWAHFNLKDFANSYNLFERQTKEFVDGKLYADGLYMLSESAFQQKKYETAYQHYTAARPVMEASKSVSPTNLWLSALHAAQSANQLKKFDEARNIAQKLANDSAADEGLRMDAELELGLAYQGLNDPTAAVAAWTRAAEDLGKTGVHARYLLGATLFAQKKFKDATLQFALAANGYGGRE